MNESNPGTQWNMPTSPLANLEDAKTSSLPVDFKMTYSGSSLPSSLDIEDNVLQNALKGGSTYHVVTVAFTEEQVSSPVAIIHVLHRNNDYKCTVYVAFHSSIYRPIPPFLLFTLSVGGPTPSLFVSPQYIPKQLPSMTEIN